MAFLDNSGDIILDAVLTDTGRMRMARADGSFKITKFALGDDEINYKLYDGTASTGNEDLQIMRTPILEAFSNNTSGMKSKLISLANNPGLFLPVLAQNQENLNCIQVNSDYNTFLCAVDAKTQGISSDGTTPPESLPNALESTTNSACAVGVMAGFSGAGCYIVIDQGLDSGTDGPSADNDISAELYESQYLIEVDSRLGSVVSSTGLTPAAVSFIDDDQIASYYLSQAVNTAFVITCPGAGNAAATDMVLAGPRGSRLKFFIRASLDLKTSTTLFNRLGSTFDVDSKTYLFIDSNVRITGVTTGSRIDIPIRFCKYSTGA